MSATNVGFGLGIGLVVIMSGSLLQELVGCAELAAREAMANPAEQTWLEIELVSIIASWDWSCPLPSERLLLFFVQSYGLPFRCLHRGPADRCCCQPGRPSTGCRYGK